MTDTPETPNASGATGTGGGATNKWPLIAGAVVLIAALVVGLVLITSDDDDETTDSVATTEAPATTVVSDTTDVPETTESPATTQAPETTEPVETTEAPTTTEPTTTVPPVPDQVRTAIWPWFETDLRYADPVEAAVGFATDYLGFVDPEAGEFMAGDSRSGEVEIRSAGT
jgi:hypothetical protein